MTIDKLLLKGILEVRISSAEEIFDLMNIVERDMKDCSAEEVSFDWQFGIAYNAALKLATILIRKSNYRVKGQGHHMNTIALIPLILGENKKEYSEYLDICRRMRNKVEYDCVGGATREDVAELRAFVKEFKSVVLSWLDKK